MIQDGVAADLAEPGIERRFPAVAVEALDRLAEGLLHHLARGIVVAAQPDQREAVQPREVGVEQPAKGALVASQNPSGKGPIDMHRFVHAA